MSTPHDDALQAWLASRSAARNSHSAPDGDENPRDVEFREPGDDVEALDLAFAGL